MTGLMSICTRAEELAPRKALMSPRIRAEVLVRIGQPMAQKSEILGPIVDAVPQGCADHGSRRTPEPLCEQRMILRRGAQE
ncbi:hypothetical protein SCLCIDRAFT_1223781 [Scleroderma citrinum Foug A]|uniref:Uncharacterized protein n=1 Tax=Scleroderma citrinum Foug A TaxID=1036808 RepID=A0A0C3D7P4_9AGAM|nr:hypothetical protein SCLCIDRAFT_1223781 [Scleroderma citrinum Foug A]